MKQHIKLGPIVSELMSLSYSSMKASQEYARAISLEPTAHKLVQNEFRNLAGNIAACLDRIERRIPQHNWDAFKQQLADNDHLRLENIKSYYQRLTPDKQALIEETVIGLAKGEIIEFVEDEK
jgi:hypothetical protein